MLRHCVFVYVWVASHLLCTDLSDVLDMLERVELGQFTQTLKTLVCVREVEGRVWSFGVVKNVKICKLALFLCLPWHSWTCEKKNGSRLGMFYLTVIGTGVNDVNDVIGTCVE